MDNMHVAEIKYKTKIKIKYKALDVEHGQNSIKHSTLYLYQYVCIHM